MVFDFVDNASQYNAPYSMHRLFKLKDYHPGGTVLGKKGDREAEADLYAKGERPDAVIDYPVDATDYEIVDTERRSCLAVSVPPRIRPWLRAR